MRKSKEITLNDRGVSKTFRITEMAATEFEWWLISAGRILVSCGLANVEVGDITSSADVQEAVARFLVKDGLSSLAHINLTDVKPLYDALLKCCELKSGGYYAPLDPQTVDGQIEDFRSLFILRKEALMLHLDFLLTAENLKSDPPQGAQQIKGTSAPKILAR